MTHSEKFIAWLEGYLDACKNKLTSANVRVIRKKIKETVDSSPTIIGSVSPLNAVYTNTSQLNDSIDDDFIKAIEENKNKTLDELT